MGFLPPTDSFLHPEMSLGSPRHAQILQPCQATEEDLDTQVRLWLGWGSSCEATFFRTIETAHSSQSLSFAYDCMFSKGNGYCIMLFLATYDFVEALWKLVLVKSMLKNWMKSSTVKGTSGNNASDLRGHHLCLNASAHLSVLFAWMSTDFHFLASWVEKNILKTKGTIWSKQIRKSKSARGTLCEFMGGSGLPFLASPVSDIQWISRWWFQMFYIFTPIWGRFPNLTSIFFKGVETTN